MSSSRQEKIYSLITKRYNSLDRTLNFVDGEDDMDFLYIGYSSRRARMSCGHTVTPMSLTDWCQQQLNEGATKFACGQTKCDAVWSYEEVCKMALLTPEEQKSFDDQLFANAAKHKLYVKSCPGCKSRVIREDPSDLCVICPKCTANHKKPYKFCWQCSRKWKGPVPSSDRCGNDNCCNEQVQTLKNCPDIKFDHHSLKKVKGCPSIRACPTCGKLLEHSTKNCKFIVCNRCKDKLCFVCLKLYPNCSNYFDMCVSGVTPRQTTIPVWAESK
uniref:RING-type domain-containing protein n=1 Tax=Neogobius melanostomus TaxID=47308 RepID=A0A8C6UEW3_9GOBI